MGLVGPRQRRLPARGALRPARVPAPGLEPVRLATPRYGVARLTARGPAVFGAVDADKHWATREGELRLLIVAENASLKMGGEASKNVKLFRLFQQKGLQVWLVCHDRCRAELHRELSSREFANVRFLEDTWLQIAIWKLGKLLPNRLSDLVVGQLVTALTQSRARKVVKNMISELELDLVFQPSPLSVTAPCFMYDLGVPVVLGPLCGGFDLPPAFRDMDSWVTRLVVAAVRRAAMPMHLLVPGKLRADALIVADPQTRASLPRGCKGRIYEMLEPAVDLSAWTRDGSPHSRRGSPVRFAFVGRLVDWKGVQFLVEAFREVEQRVPSVLELIGDGVLRAQLEARVTALGLEHCIKFRGWQEIEECRRLLSDCDVFVMPSLRESGGHAVLEAMAMGLPVIVADWGGLRHTVDSSCGIRVDVTTRAGFVQGLAEAMIRMAESPGLRSEMGHAAGRRVRKDDLDWSSKCDRLISIFNEVLDGSVPARQLSLSLPGS